MRPPALLCAGEAFEDLVFVGLENIPRPGEVAHSRDYVATIGGGAVITAVAAARLGLHVSIASGLSSLAARTLRAEGIRVRNLRRHGEPVAVTAALSVGHERAFVTFAGVNAQIEPRLAHALTLTRATHVHLAFQPRQCERWVERLAHLKTRGITLSCDLGWSQALAADPALPLLFDTIDVVFVNAREAKLYAGATRFPSALAYWRRRRGVVVIKRGKDGCLWLGRGREHASRGRTLKPVDTTGAGDSFDGGFLWAWLHGAPPAQCLAAGNAVGAASTRKAGGLEALPRQSELPPTLRTIGRSPVREP